jgi:hypothetical protein
MEKSTPDFQKPIEAIKNLMSMQAETMTKTVELQKKASEELMTFFKTEVEKAKQLKTPEDVIKFNVDVNTALYQLLKTQGEDFASLVTDASKAMMAQVQNFGK